MILRIPMLTGPGGPETDEYALLTDEHAASRYGQPMLVWRGEPYGPDERLAAESWAGPDTGRDIVASYLDRDTTVEALATEEIRALLGAYLRHRR